MPESGLYGLQGPIHKESLIPLRGFSVAGDKEEALFRVLFKAWGRPDPGWLVVQSVRT